MARRQSPFGSDIRVAAAAGPDGDTLAVGYSIGAVGDHGVTFTFLLRQSAHAIERGRALITARGDEIARLITVRGARDAMLAGQAARLLIALFWVFVGVVLAREAASGPPARGLDAASAATLARIFVAVGVLGAVAAFVGGYLIRAGETAGLPDRNFGSEAGAIVRDFAQSIEALADRIAEEGRRDAGEDVSRLHLVGLEAAAFIEGIGFLTEPDHHRAEERFQAFLDARSTPAGFGARLALVALALAVIIVVAAVSGGFGGGLLGVGLPGWAILALPGLAVLYAGLGSVFAAVAGVSAAGGAAARARQIILSSLRRSYAASGAPKAEDLLGAVETALRGFRNRVSHEHRDVDDRGVDRRSDWESSSGSGGGSGGGSDWRDAGEPPRFAPQAFAAAPPSFRVDSQPRSRKIFSTGFGSGGRRNAAPKQPPSAPDAPPWLKD